MHSSSSFGAYSPLYTVPSARHTNYLLTTNNNVGSPHTALFNLLFAMPPLPSPPASPSAPTPQYAPQPQPSRRRRAEFNSARVIPNLRRHETMLFGDPLKTVPCQSQGSFESISGGSNSSGSGTSQESIRTEAC